MPLAKLHRNFRKAGVLSMGRLPVPVPVHVYLCDWSLLLDLITSSQPRSGDSKLRILEMKLRPESCSAPAL